MLLSQLSPHPFTESHPHRGWGIPKGLGLSHGSVSWKRVGQPIPNPTKCVGKSGCGEAKQCPEALNKYVLGWIAECLSNS